MNKNIYLLPTDKPSRLVFEQRAFERPLLLKSEPLSITKDSIGQLIHEPQYIYITSDEEIKEGFVTDGESVFKVISNNFNTVRLHDKHNNLIKLHESRLSKIILTTDPDLIADGVQPIDDEFLEWFVKNPSCEFVEVEELGPGFPAGIYFINYLPEHFEKPIIPQEEPKPLFANGQRVYLKEDNNVSQVVDDNTKDWSLWELLPKQEKLTYTEAVKKEERIFNSIMMKQETLEEAKENWANEGSWCCPISFVEGAKWQAERMYSEEDMKQFGLYLGDNLKKLKNKSIDKIFKQFKKK